MDVPAISGKNLPPTAAADGLNISLESLAPIVNRILGRDDLAIQDWSVQPLHYTVRSAVSAGLYRLLGTAGAGPVEADPIAWSLILKVVQPQNGDSLGDPGHWNYWRREPLAYQTGLLEKFTQRRDVDLAGLTVPRCWQVEEKADGRVWLWLEDVAETGGGRWPSARYGLAARHLGAFQGGFLAEDLLPTDPWLSRGWMRARVASFAGAMQRLHDPTLWDQPMVRRTCPRTLEGRLAQLWDLRAALLDALDRLPQTLCHLDVWRPNLMSRPGADGEQTVALDWAYVGIGAVGQDIGNLVPDSLGNFDVDIDQTSVLDQAVFGGYLQGLRETGWTGDARLARLGYAASAALGWGLGTPWWLVWPQDAERQARIERQWGRPLEELLSQRVVLTEFVLGLADEAQELLSQETVRMLLRG